MADLDVPAGYAALLDEAKRHVQAARTRAALAVNSELIELYWRLGRLILDVQARERWGARVIDRLSADLRAEFPEMRGLGRTNLKDMRQFAAAWPVDAIGRQLVGQLPWGHNIELVRHVEDHSARVWYAERAIEHGWSRDTLGLQIMNQLHLREGAALTNFATALPPADSDLIGQLFKDPYRLEFLDVDHSATERELEQSLIRHVERFLLELGAGFAFVGRQYALEVGGQDFFLDLLFFHIPTRRYLVIELKRGAFTPEAAGKLHFYVNVVNDQLRVDGDQPTIGLLLCRDRDEIVVRYSLSGMANPLAVSGYRLGELPPEAAASLPAEAGLIAAVDAVLDSFDDAEP